MTNRESVYSSNKALTVEVFTLGQKEEWNKALSGLTVPCYQTWEYCKAISVSQYGICLLKIFDQEGALTLTYSSREKFPGRFDVYSPYGFGGIVGHGEGQEELFSQSINFFKSNNAVTGYLMAHPVYPPKIGTGLEVSRTAFVLNLGAPVDTIWENMYLVNRQELRKLLNDEKIRISDNKDMVLSSLDNLYQETLKRVGASETYYFSSTCLKALAENENCLLLGGIVDEEVEAVVMILYSQFSAEYFINASSLGGRRLTRLLLWEAIKRLKELGVSYFNMGGGVKEGDQLGEFKKRFGGDPVRIPVYKFISDKHAYEETCMKLGVAIDDQSYFPAYWKPATT